MKIFTFNQLGENLPDLEGIGNTEYEAVSDIARSIGGIAVHPFGEHHWAISVFEGTGLTQIILKYVKED